MRRPDTPGSKPRLLSPADVQAEYSLTLAHQRRLRQSRRIPFVRVGHRTVRYERADIEAYLYTHRVAALPAGGGE